MTFAFALVRALHLASLMMLFGSAVLLARLRIRIPELAIESSGLRRLRLALAGVALLTTPLWLAFTAGQMAGDAGAMIDPGTLGLTLTSTLFGQLLAVRLVLLLLLIATLLARWEIFTALLAGLGLALISVTSHAAEASPANFAAIGITTDALHLLCGGIWLGGLCVLGAIMAQRRAAPRLPDALSLFAGWGMVAVALMAMTGLINAATIVLGGPGAASRTLSGRVGRQAGAGAGDGAAGPDQSFPAAAAPEPRR